MAILKSIATGNWTSASTWGLVDSTSYNNSESTTTALTTSYQASLGSTTGVITVSGICLKLATRTGTTGTMSVHLAIAGVEVVGSLVTINVADLPVALASDLNGGWHFFKFASPVTLVGATSYTVEAKTSSAAQVSLHSLATTNWSRALVTTTTQAPVAGDDVILAGEYTGAGTSNSFVVTMNETATTDYGSATTSAVTPAVSICNKSILRCAVTAATNFNLKVSGNMIVYSGGELDLGTTGSPMPRDSSITLLFDSFTNVDFGLFLRENSTFIAQGLSRTSGKLIDRCFLNTDEAANSTSLGVGTDTGWLDNDVIAIASTTRTAGQCEAGTLNGNASSSTLTVDGFAGTAGGVLNAHSGTAPIAAEVILLTRNVVIRGASATQQTFITISSTVVVDCDWVEFKWMGSNTAGKRGIGTACTTGSQNFQNCSLHDFKVTGSTGLNMAAVSGTGLVFSNNVTFDIHSAHLTVSANSGSSVFDNNIFMLSTAASPMIPMSDVGGTFTNNSAIGSADIGIQISESNTVGTYSGIICHSNNVGFSSAFGLTVGNISTLTAWRNASAGLQMISGELTYTDLIAFGNGSQNVLFSSRGCVLFLINPTLNGDSTFSTTNGIDLSNTGTLIELHIFGGSLGSASGIKTAHTIDLLVGAMVARVFLNNTLLASATEVSGQASMSPTSFVAAQKHDQTAGLHKMWKRNGNIAIDTSTVHSPGVTSMKMTPSSASLKLDSIGPFGGFKVQVANGQTCTPTIFVQEDGPYNGARSRLIVKRNDAMGISADTVLDTATSASDAAWEGLTGTTATVTDNGVLEFSIDCDGTAGNLYVASASAVVA